MIKITKPHTRTTFTAKGIITVVECDSKEASIFQSITGKFYKKDNVNTYSEKEGKYFKIIIISKIEEILSEDVGTHVYDYYLKKVILLTKDLFEIKHTKTYYKILAFPRNISYDFTNKIISGEYKNGNTVEIEVEEYEDWNDDSSLANIMMNGNEKYYRIKNTDNYFNVIVHK